MSSPTSPLLDLIARVHGILDIAELREAMLDAVLEAVPADWVSLNELGPNPDDGWFIVKPPVPEELVGVFAELIHENPLLARWMRTRDGRAYRFSDVATQDELDGLRLFREFYTPLGIRHQIAFTLPSPKDRVLAIVLSRQDPDFSDAERDLLNEARPFLIQSYRNAIAYSRALASSGPRADPHASPASEPGPPTPSPDAQLTTREAEILRWIASGRSNAAIAKRLGISARTVQKHLEHAYRKLGVHSRSDAAELLWSIQPSETGRAGEQI